MEAVPQKGYWYARKSTKESNQNYTNIYVKAFTRGEWSVSLYARKFVFLELKGGGIFPILYPSDLKEGGHVPPIDDHACVLRTTYHSWLSKPKDGLDSHEWYDLSMSDMAPRRRTSIQSYHMSRGMASAKAEVRHLANSSIYLSTQRRNGLRQQKLPIRRKDGYYHHRRVRSTEVRCFVWQVTLTYLTLVKARHVWRD